jgi:hypothetical protein
MSTWWERVAEREAAEATAGESAGGFSDQVSRSAVDVCGFLTGVLLSILFFLFLILILLNIIPFFFFVFTNNNNNCNNHLPELETNLKK